MSTELGWLDTNIFVHALFEGDPFYGRCKAIVDGLETGKVTGWIDPLVVHELTYVLKRLPQFKSTADIHEYIRSILFSDYVYADDKAALGEALARWADEGISFTDAWLAVVSQRRGLPVCSVNRRDFENVHNSFPEQSSR